MQNIIEVEMSDMNTIARCEAEDALWDEVNWATLRKIGFSNLTGKPMRWNDTHGEYWSCDIKGTLSVPAVLTRYAAPSAAEMVSKVLCPVWREEFAWLYGNDGEQRDFLERPEFSDITAAYINGVLTFTAHLSWMFELR